MLAVSMQYVKASLAANIRGSFPAKLKQGFPLGKKCFSHKGLNLFVSLGIGSAIPVQILFRFLSSRQCMLEIGFSAIPE